MFTGTINDGRKAIPLYDAWEERLNVTAQGTPTTNGLTKSTDLRIHNANSFTVSDDGASGYVLVRRGDLNTLNLNARFTLTFATDKPAKSLTWNGLVICREPQVVIPSNIQDDEGGICLVELADARWLVHNPYFSQSCARMYNVSSNASNGAGGPTTYLSTSLNSGSPWTWSDMIGDLWGLMTSQLGVFPGLPVTPNGNPTGWIFEGTSAFLALRKVLGRISCTIATNLTAPVGSQFFIVQVGAADAATDLIISTAEARNQKIHDGEFQETSRGRIPYGVRVFYHKQLETPTQIPPFLNNTPYTVDVVGPDTTDTEPGIYHPIWDDLPALYDGSGTLTNGAALSARATERTNDFYRALRSTGGARLWKRYSGLLAINTGSTVNTVSWRCVRAPRDESDDSAENGIFTDVVRYPAMAHGECCPAADYQSSGVVWDLIRLGFPSNIIPTGLGTTTTLPITVPIIGDPVTITVPIGTPVYPGQPITITDPGGGTVITGTIIDPITTTTITVIVWTIPVGAPGGTIPGGSTISIGTPPPPTFGILTDGTFVVPALGSPVTVTVQSTLGMPSTGESVVITDGTNYVSGIAIPTSATTLTFVPTIIQAGAPGNTVATLATVIPQPLPTTIGTTAGFMIPAIGTGVTVNTTTTSNLTTNQIVTINDGTHIVQGYVTSSSGTTFTFTPLTIYAGSVGDTVLTSATITPGNTFYQPITTIASGTTTDLSTIASSNVSITGTTTIAGFGTVPPGVIKLVTFTGALTLTYNATSLIIPGAKDLTTAAGDYAELLSLGSGDWEVVDYTVKAAAPYPGGAYLETVLITGSAVSLTTATTADVTSVSLPPGDWDVTGVVDYALVGSKVDALESGTRETSATFGGQDSSVTDSMLASSISFSGKTSQIVPTQRYVLTVTTTIYLLAKWTGTGSAAAYGNIRARQLA